MSDQIATIDISPLLRRGFFLCLADIAESAERFSPDGEILGHTDYTDYTDYACLAASGISLLIPQKAKAKYRKKQKQNTAKN